MTILIADSGSTKTAWSVIETSSKTNTCIFTQGINPFQQTEEEIGGILQHELIPNIVQRTLIDIDAIHFYGAGCTKEKAPIVAAALRRIISSTGRIFVESDMLGAARGLCGHNHGIVCILGTGSNSCYYDGKDITANVSPLGYILGDEGSGAYIGKRLVGDILKRQFPKEIRDAFFDETHETAATIIQKVYRELLPNRFLASLSPFCARHRQHPAMNAFLIDCFTQFFKRNIDLYPSLVSKGDFGTVNFIGSIAYYYKDEIIAAASACGYKIGKILQSPLEGLIDYHTA